MVNCTIRFFVGMWWNDNCVRFCCVFIVASIVAAAAFDAAGIVGFVDSFDFECW